MGNSPSNPSNIKSYLNKSNVEVATEDSKNPLQDEYSRKAAYSLIAYTSGSEHSNLDNARINFQKKYIRFLILYGQFSNTPLTAFGTNESLTYPITEETEKELFKIYGLPGQSGQRLP
jgi:hypothetical protein